MEDPFGPARQAVYDRISYHSMSGLFTRPAILAIEEDHAGGLPKQALNLACRKLLDSPAGSGINAAETVLRAARECGFTDSEQFSALFREATGWYPDEWYRRFGRDTMP